MRRITRTITSACVLLASLGACSVQYETPSTSPQGSATTKTAHAATVRAQDARLPRSVPGEYLVKFRSAIGPNYAANALRGAAFSVRRSYRAVPGLHHIVAAQGVNADAAAAQLARDPGVEYVEPNFIVRAAGIPNDPLFPKQWALQNVGQTGGSSTANPDIGAVAAWNITTGSSNVVIAVIDSGVDYNHVDLAANMWSNPTECNNNGIDNDGDGYVNDCHGINALTKTGDPMDDFFHGTHVAGTIGAVGNNAVGVTGVNWNVSIMACKFLDSTGTGNTADAVTCLDYIALKKDNGVNIIASSNSWGGGAYSQALSDAIVAQRMRGILFVAAAGNDSFDNDQLPLYPCSYDLSNIICVASAYDALSIFSDYGTGTVHLAAPGEAIWSTVLNNGYDAYDGTSMATPHVTGVLGLLKSQDSTRDWRTLKNLVLAGAVPPTQGKIPTLTGGRLYAPNSMNCTNAVVEARMRPGLFDTITLAVGGSLRLEAINIRCGTPNGNVVVRVAPSGEIVTLVDDGTNTDEVAGDGIYSGVWTATAPGSYTLTFPGRAGDVVNVEVDAMLKPGFPTKMYVVPDGDGVVRPANVSLIVGNIDGNPGVDILAPGYGAGPVYAWRGDGTAVPGWPNYHVTATSEISLGHFAANSNGLGVVAAAWLQGLFLYNGDGSAIAGWPQSSTLLYFPPPTADLDGDGIDEIIGFPARRADGSVFNANVGIPPVDAANSNITSSVAVADLDADGKPDIVVANGQYIWAENAQGVLAGFPVPTPGTSSGFINPVIGDVDGDGRPEIIVPTVTWLNGAGYLAVNVYTNEGVLLRTMQTTEPVTNQIVALADLDGDGIPEIIASTGTQVYVWKGDGTPVAGWPVSVGTDEVGPVAVGDVDGNGYPEIVFTSGTLVTPANPVPNGHLYALDRFGKSLTGFPKTLPSTTLATTPAIADLDGNGRNILIVNPCPDVGLRDAVLAYDLKGTGPYGPIEWGQFMGGPDHHGYYETGKNLPLDAFLTAQAHGAGTITSTDGAINCGSTCIHKYPKGTTVSLMASAATGATFTHWLGPCAGQGNPCRLSVTAYTPIAADFASPVTITLTGSGSVISSPAGISCPSGACSTKFPARTTVTLTATAASGSAFNGWGGACTGSGATCTLTMNAAKAVSAQFVSHRTLSLRFGGQGTAHVVSSPSGIDCGAGGTSCTAQFPPGAAVTLTLAPSADTYLTDWSSPGCLNYQNTCRIIMSQDVSATVSLALKPVVAITVNGQGSVIFGNPNLTCTASCTFPADLNSQVQLTAVDATESDFTGWGGDCAGTLNSCFLTVDASKNVSANFSPKLKLTVTVSGSGQGRVQSSDGLLGCTSGACVDYLTGGASITLTATPSSSSSFSGWAGACSGSQSACTLTVSANASVNATFTSTSTSGGNGGSSGAGGHSGGGGGGGALDFFSLAALAGLAAGRRRR